MSEQALATEAQPGNGERLTQRRSAVAHLATDMLRLFGEAEDHWRSVTWQDSGRTYCLSHGDVTQHQTEQTNQRGDWLHVAGPNGEYDAYSLADNELAAPDDTFEEIAGALNRHATQHVFNLARGHLATRGDTFETSHNNRTVQFQDFTAAEHEPFIWVRITNRYVDQVTAYDLTAAELRCVDQFDASGPVHPDSLPEEHVRWMLRAVTQPAKAVGEEPGYYSTGGRSSMYIRSEENRQRETIDDHSVEEAHSVMREVRKLPPSEALEIWEENGITLVRTVLGVGHDSLAAQKAGVVPTVLGIAYDQKSLYMETFPVDSDFGPRITATANLAERTAYGTQAANGEVLASYRGDAAIQEIFDHLEQLAITQMDEELVVCTPAMAAHFRYVWLRPRPADDESSVQ